MRDGATGETNEREKILSPGTAVKISQTFRHGFTSPCVNCGASGTAEKFSCFHCSEAFTQNDRGLAKHLLALANSGSRLKPTTLAVLDRRATYESPFEHRKQLIYSFIILIKIKTNNRNVKHLAYYAHFCS